VVTGVDIIEKIGKVKTDTDDHPIKPIKVNTVTVIDSDDKVKVLPTIVDHDYLIDKDRNDSFAARFARRR
jgi:hypothetical protein